MRSPTTDRRSFLALMSALGLTSTLFPGVLWSRAQGEKKITAEMIDEAAAIADVEIADEYKEMMLGDLNDYREAYEKIHQVAIPNQLAPAFVFDPVLPGMSFEQEKKPLTLGRIAAPDVPKNIEDLAFSSVRELGDLVRTRKVSSTALTEMYLERLKRYDPLLHFVVTYTEERALAQAAEADREIAAGKYRGPLHGLPWGAKDLLAVKGYPTTWGAKPYQDQVIDETATVVKRLDEAGAVLVAKTTLGALAWGDVWFGGKTRNPWNPEQGSSGSSAGSGSATAAGCVAFSLGSETWGSIASPCTRNGATGLRPTFGRVPRTGAMALCWTMDKLGPICRAVEDCALVLDAIYGPDGQDRTVHGVAFNWDATLDPRKLRIGYLKGEFEKPPEEDMKPEEREQYLEWRRLDQESLDVFRGLGFNLIELQLPDLAADAMSIILNAEAAAAFDELTRSGRDRLLVRQEKDAWPNVFRSSHFIPAVEYINANRLRMLEMQAMDKLFQQADVVVAPTFSDQLLITNLTGHPAVILPSGFRSDGTPVSLTFLAGLYKEGEALAVAQAFQQATEWHRKHPPLDEFLRQREAVAGL